MKTKIFALIVCAACLVSVLTACGGTSACTTCTDADKNAKCDVCGTPVVTIVEKVPTEEEVKDTVVNPIPDNVKPADVINIVANKEFFTQGAKTVENLNAANAELFGNLIKISYTEIVTEDEENSDNNVYRDVYKFYNPASDEILLTLDSGEYTKETKDERTTYEFNVLRYPVYPYRKITNVVTKREYVFDEENGSYSYKTTYNYYSAAMKLNFTSEYKYSSYGAQNDVYSIEVDGTYYIFDNETGEVAFTFPSDAYIQRPEFTATRGNYGYVKNGATVSVFDLTKWIECVYNYEIPAYYVQPKTFYLENGNILVQGLVNVPADTENYDVLVEGTKYDVVYTMVNPTEKTVTDVEFGYYINSLNDTFDVEVKDNVKNYATVQSLDAKQLGGTMELWLDNELNVVADVERLYPAFTSGQPQVIADNRLLVTIVYGEGSSVKKVVDGNGAVIAIVPNSAELKGGYFEIDNKYYNLDLALAFDPAAEEYTVVYEKAEYVILLKDGDYYFWNTSLTAPKLVVDALDDSVEGTVKIQTLGATVEENRFVVITTTTVEGEATTTYTLYGANGAVILEAEAAIVEFASITDVEGVYRIVLADGTWYIARA